MMSKICPKCGKELPDDARFCMDCGYTIDVVENAGSSSGFPISTLFIILIVAVLVIGGAFIFTSGFGDNGKSSDDADGTGHTVDLTITDICGWDDFYDGKTVYTLYTEAIFNKVPQDMKGYNVKTTYYDSNNTEIGHETQTLEDIYYDSDYALGFGYCESYKKPDPDHMKVEIIKGGKIIDNYTEQINKNKIDFLN